MAWGQVANIRGPQGPTGPAGADGAGIAIAGSVATYANLPTGLGSADAGDGYLVEADGLLYIWSGASFPSNGAGVAFQGPEGPQGIQGIQGIQGVQGATGSTGATGPRGSKWFTGSGAPTTVSGSAVGDFYLDVADGTVYELT